MTQEHIADCTGLTPVHVNRMLKLLEQENLISRRSSRAVTIGDWNRLANAGDFDSTYLHLREDELALTIRSPCIAGIRRSRLNRAHEGCEIPVCAKIDDEVESRRLLAGPPF